MNDPLEQDVYKPVNISHLSCLISFASYFCGFAGFTEFILIIMPGALIFIITLPNLMHFLKLCYMYISNLALTGPYLVYVRYSIHHRTNCLARALSVQPVRDRERFNSTCNLSRYIYHVTSTLVINTVLNFVIGITK